MKINEMMGVNSAAGMGAALAGVDPSSAEAKRFAEPGVPKNRKKKSPVMTVDPLKRKGLKSFGEWFDLQRNTDDPGHSD
jgi:hypothetical protein